MFKLILIILCALLVGCSGPKYLPFDGELALYLNDQDNAFFNDAIQLWNRDTTGIVNLKITESPDAIPVFYGTCEKDGVAACTQFDNGDCVAIKITREMPNFSTAAHEIGHCLGLRYWHSPDINSVMHHHDYGERIYVDDESMNLLGID